MFLTGDRNLTNGTPTTAGLLTVTTNRLSDWTDAMHAHRGNVGLVDGTVPGFSPTMLQRAVENTGVTTNRLAMP